MISVLPCVCPSGSRILKKRDRRLIVEDLTPEIAFHHNEPKILKKKKKKKNIEKFKLNIC